MATSKYCFSQIIQKGDTAPKALTDRTLPAQTTNGWSYKAAPTRSPITTHVLDTTLGRPAQRVPITLEVRGADGSWSTVGSGMTDDDGRLPTLLTPGTVSPSWVLGTWGPNLATFVASRKKVIALLSNTKLCPWCSQDLSAFPTTIFRITFDTATYFAAIESSSFYPGHHAGQIESLNEGIIHSPLTTHHTHAAFFPAEVSIVFEVSDPTQHYHVPLLLNPYGYSTYRGS